MSTLANLKVNQSKEYTAHGATFTVKKHDAGVYSLNASNIKVRNRWGNLAEITADLAHCLTYGKLPRPANWERF